MIRINLLSVGPPTTVAKEVGPPSTTLRHMVAFAVTALISGGVVFGFYSVWSRDVARLQQDLKKEQRRQAELKGVQDQNRLYQQQLQQLETRINTIQTLQNSKSGPVDFMTALGNLVNHTTDLFLFSVAPDGDRLAIKGQSTTVESMAQFIFALKNSTTFTDVQLRQYWEDDQQNRVAYKFNLDCVYRQPGIAPAAAPAAAPGAAVKRTGM
jgi:Tfp pilus assembly protein PilN